MTAIPLPAGENQPVFHMLGGVKVLDLTTSVAGPYATMLLSDFGAEVIKVERPGGDDSRHWGPPFLDGDSLWFIAVNRNKKSVVLDYGRPEGRAVLDALIERADVVVVNQTLSVQRKLGLDAGSLRAGKPGLIHVSITGFGLTGANADLPCYDLIAEGYSGIMDLTGPPEAEPQKVGAPAADMLAGTDAAMVTLAALHRRAATGAGSTIDIALTESMIRFVSPRITPYMGSGDVPRRSGGKDSVIAVYQTFETADLPLTLGLGNDAIWRRFWAAVGHPEMADLEGLASNAERRLRRPEIVARIQEILLGQPRAEWLARFARAKVPAGPIYRVDEVVEDAHLRERGLFFQVDRGGCALPQVGLGVQVDGSPCGYVSPPPRLGQHTGAVLGEALGFDADRIAALKTLGVI